MLQQIYRVRASQVGVDHHLVCLIKGGRAELTDRQQRSPKVGRHFFGMRAKARVADQEQHSRAPGRAMNNSTHNDGTTTLNPSHYIPN